MTTAGLLVWKTIQLNGYSADNGKFLCKFPRTCSFRNESQFNRQVGLWCLRLLCEYKQRKQKIRLEPIQEESEKEDGIKEGETGERQEAHIQSTEDVVAEDESNEEDEVVLRSRRPRSRLQMQSTVSELKETKRFPIDSTPHSFDLSETPSPRPPSLDKVRWCSPGKWGGMVSIFAVSGKINNKHWTEKV